MRKPIWAAGLLISALAGMVSPANAQAGELITITNFHHTGTVSTLGWTSDGGETAYTVQFQDTLSDVIWRLPPSTEAFPVATNRWSSPPGTNESAFYRVLSVPAAQRGKLVSAAFVSTLPATLLNYMFGQAGLPVTAQYGVRQYRIGYETITPLGARVMASGALFLPEGVGATLPLLSYQHGTIIQTNKAPSSLDPNGEAAAGLVLASAGYAVVMPDYLGLGTSPGLHPYHHARSEATAGVDLLRAVKTLCATNGYPVSDRLFLCGYSQGGHATLALLKELETHHTNEFAVTACAPMAGAYDLSGTTAEDFLSPRVKPNPYYFLYLLAAYQEVYRLGPSLASLLAPPYDSTLPPLMNGNTSGGQINAAMPADPVQILKPEYLADFRSNPRNPLRLALLDNDLFRWQPRAPLRLYHCSGDQDVVFANSQTAYAAFQAAGAAQVQLINPLPGADHGDCVEPSLLLAKAWFDSLR